MLYLNDNLLNRMMKCVRYIYGGCYGTKNLFRLKSECETTCPIHIENTQILEDGTTKITTVSDFLKLP